MSMKAGRCESGYGVVQKALYWRGLFITRYAAIEFGIAELVSRGFLHDAYSHLGHPHLAQQRSLRGSFR